MSKKSASSISSNSKEEKSAIIEPEKFFSLSKTRFEAITDGVFAIVMTLLVIEMKLPEAVYKNHLTSFELLRNLWGLKELFVAYFVSFAVLAMFWLSHNFTYHITVKNITRPLIMINILYLSFISLIPFSANLLGHYWDNSTAVVWYGINILIISLIDLYLLSYVKNSPSIDNTILSTRSQKQGKIRRLLTIGFTVIGIICGFIYTPLSFFFYAFPVVFNVVPGLLNATEKLLGFEIK
jgi:uncharacterized membrane protein